MKFLALATLLVTAAGAMIALGFAFDDRWTAAALTIAFCVAGAIVTIGLIGASSHKH